MSRPADDQHHQQPLPALFLPLFRFPFFRPPLPPPPPLPFLPPPLALFLHLLRHNVPSASAPPPSSSSGLSIRSSASTSARSTGMIMSIERLIGDQQSREGGQSAAEEANDTAHCSSSSATIPCILTRLQLSTSAGEQRPTTVHLDGPQNTLKPGRHTEIPTNLHSLCRAETIVSSGKVLRKLVKGAKNRDEQEEGRGGGGGEERKQRRKGRGTHKVCFGLTPEEKAQIRETEASGGEGAAGFGCPRCGKVFSYEYYRDKHLKYTRCVDTGNRRFPCPLCPRSFEKRDRLRIHVLHVHERYRPHACSLCPKAFSQSSSLNKHLRTHSGERPYQCPHCEKAFTASSILRTHIRQHSGEKPFKCADCGKSFASHAAHDSHVRRTHQQ